MTDTKWTPGPWAVTVESGTVYVTRRWSGDYTPEASDLFGSHLGGHVAAADFHTFDGGICSKTRAVANANLIAAAPELYEALAILEPFFINSGEARTTRWVTLARKSPEIIGRFVPAMLDALRKARGEA